MEVCRRMVTRSEPKVHSRFRGTLEAILFPRWDIPDSDVTHLSTAWEKQVRDCEQQIGDNIADAIKLGVVLHHLLDASLREHLFQNSRSYDMYILMASGTDVLSGRHGCSLAFDERLLASEHLEYAWARSEVTTGLHF